MPIGSAPIFCATLLVIAQFVAPVSIMADSVMFLSIVSPVAATKTGMRNSCTIPVSRAVNAWPLISLKQLPF